MKTLATYETGKGKTFDLTETLEKQNKELRKALENLSAVATMSDIAFSGANVNAKKVLKDSQTTFENLVINPAAPKEHFLIGSNDMPGMAVIYANADTAKKLICEAVSENLDAEKVKVVEMSDFNHKTYQFEAKVKITQDGETNEETIYLTPISIYK